MRRNFPQAGAFPWANSSEEIFMRTARPVIAIVLVCLSLAACGSSRRTVIVNPPPDSTTVVERDGSATVIENR
jgi:hypothetical protein